ncbi:MAG: DNA methyltransferase [Acidimicrobiia bacterium]
MDSYRKFLNSKRIVVGRSGKAIGPDEVSAVLFEFQRDLTRWAIGKGRSAIFADTGLGKTLMQLEWARLVDGPVLIVAPLAVAQQTIREAEKLGWSDDRIAYHRSQPDDPQIVITNYEMVDRFDPDRFEGIVLDESSILKSYSGKIRTRLIEQFVGVPYRLACTATPAPNDIAEIANHAEFLGVMSRTDMLASFFVHDDDGWRLKSHARERFYRWMASWGMSVKAPSDLGYDDDGFLLPDLNVHEHVVAVDYAPEGRLFSYGLEGIGERAAVRNLTADDRAGYLAGLIDDGEQWIVWCGLNKEQEIMARLVTDARSVTGSDPVESKVEALAGFQAGRHRVLLTKPRIAGFGMNFQNCARMAFLGLNDSFEQYYQAVRRCWRFGQSRPVEAHVVLSAPEIPIFANVKRKEREAEEMSQELIRYVAEYQREEIGDMTGTDTFTYATDEVTTDDYRLMLGDSSERLAELADDTIDFCIFSPPFLSLFVYSPTERDLGNSSDPEEFWEHFSWVSGELYRLMKPGRLIAVHCQQVATTLAHHGRIGLIDFRGQNIRHYQQAGFIYHGEICIDKDPQAQAIRTHSKALLFTQKDKDSSWLRPAHADYIMLFRKPGDNAVPIKPDIDNDTWIEWARPIWYNIRESDTLNVAEARSEKDERHIAPLQLETIERCVRLWSNPGELILSPFAGIGSEGYQSILLGRRFVGVELKPEYFDTACRNLQRAVAKRDQPTLL